MNLEVVFDYSMHFLQTVVSFISGPVGVLFLGVAVLLIIVYFFNDLRR